jgi:hypothetical protein
LAEAKRGCPPANPSLVAGERREDGGASCAPHSEQNFAEAGLPWPHAGQARGSGAPHSEQNFAASGTLALQLGHFIDASRTTARHIQAATVTRLSQATSGAEFHCAIARLTRTTRLKANAGK